MAKNYDPNKDYAAAIKNESDPAKKQQLITERQNKIDAMNAAGTNKNNYSNDIYSGGNNSSTGNKTTGTSSGNKTTGNSNGSSGYYDPNKDYAAEIARETDPVKKAQLMQERANKIAAMDAAGTNTGGYTNDIYNNGGNNGQTVNKEDFGYFDSGKDYAAEIARETDPVRKAQLIQERQNKLNYLNATGQNQQGFTNNIYGNNTATSFGGQTAMGQYQTADDVLNNLALGKMQMDAATNAALAGMSQSATQELATVPAALQGTNYEQALALATTPEQKAALQAYFTRLQANIDPSEQQGTYAGDVSMSLPDQALIAQYQAAYNQAKERGDTAAMAAAHQMAEKVRNNYRYYPTAKSNGYGLGENDIGWIRDIVVRVDDLGNKYVDQYNQGTVTTTKYDKDGNFVNQLKGTSISGHDDYVANQWERALENGNEDRWTAFRLADANDVNLSAAELMAKYGAEAGMGQELYTTNRINGKIANGMTGAGTPIVQTAQGTAAGQTAQNAAAGQAAQGTAIGQAAANTAANSAQAYGYFDPNLDYAAAIAKETDPTRRAQLMQERQNKIDYLNGTGQNPNGYTNAIYGQTQTPAVQETMLPEYLGATQEELQAAYDKIAALQEQAVNNQLALTQAQLQEAQTQANSEYDNLAREAYINMRLSQNALPQQLAALGISGGGSESANLKLQTNYQNNLHTSEQARAQALKDFALQGLQAQTQANSDIANINASAAQNALNTWLSEQANQNSWNQWLANFQLQQQQYKDSLSQYEYEKQQNALTQAIELAQLTGDYSKLKAMGYDTSYMEQLKDANLKQMALEALYTQAQTAKVNGSVTSGSGGGTKKSSGNTSSNNNNNNNSSSDLSITNRDNGAAIYVPGLRWVSYADLDKMIDAGTVKEEVNGSKVTYKKVW